MNTTLSPYELDILMTLYTQPHLYEAKEEGGAEGMQVKTVRKFMEMGITEPSMSGGLCKLNDLGMAWIQTILNTPIPAIAYLDAAGKVIGESDWLLTGRTPDKGQVPFELPSFNYGE